MGWTKGRGFECCHIQTIFSNIPDYSMTVKHEIWEVWSNIKCMFNVSFCANKYYVDAVKIRTRNLKNMKIMFRSPWAGPNFNAATITTTTPTSTSLLSRVIVKVGSWKEVKELESQVWKISEINFTKKSLIFNQI